MRIASPEQKWGAVGEFYLLTCTPSLLYSRPIHIRHKLLLGLHVGVFIALEVLLLSIYILANKMHFM